MFDPVLADIRFGCGLSPHIAPPHSAEAMLAGLTAPDTMARSFAVVPFAEFSQDMLDSGVTLGRINRMTKGTEANSLVIAQIRKLRQRARKAQRAWLVSHVARRVHSPTPFRERLESFWADHFTVRGKANVLEFGVSPYVESAIRPNFAARFEDLLIAAALHPMMLHYLDQHASAGPNAERAKNAPGKFGFNENLARELLELHTLGVDGPYTQADVRQLAELLTGLMYSADDGTIFRQSLAEPGDETVLGKRYGGHPGGGLQDIHAALRDLARHPVTARHITQKLAVHFVADMPDPDLIAAMERAWLDTDGALLPVYKAMLSHPATWQPRPANAKQPLDFIASACRALDVPHAVLTKRAYVAIEQPMRLMGHFWQEPSGPDGLPEGDDAWLTPQGLAARLQWAFVMPQTLLGRLPDPREFVQTALGSRADQDLRFAASAAETRADGIGVVLASPAFQRM
ncbi:DUF1800 domain-containing protein [Mameliella sediminis]|uniref:DUF1800 domain-containing protein n=1 Tax=Mameliella sediminis TaxID=2836866 RepID=UPI001C447A77|nr:DUF1800 domain-containing protein [Mameliella sediminis]MBV7395029.1 DUF1800 domain-containing protein [Mameliella sediminis]